MTETMTGCGSRTPAQRSVQGGLLRGGGISAWARPQPASCVAGIQPALWSREDVLHWLRWAEGEYALQRTRERGFEMNGRALCILTKDDFRLRAPGSGPEALALSSPWKPTQARREVEGRWLEGHAHSQYRGRPPFFP